MQRLKIFLNRIDFRLTGSLPFGENKDLSTSNKSHLKNELLEFCQRSGLRKWCPGTLGNISVLNPDTAKVYIKRSGADMNRLSLEDVVTINVGGQVLEGGGRPSIETNFHLAIYKVRKDARAVFHVHPPFATAFAVKSMKIPMVTEAAKTILVDIPLLSHSPAGSIELAEKVANAFRDARVNVVLLSGHGLVSVGRKLEEAFQLTDLAEDSAKVALLSSLL